MTNQALEEAGARLPPGPLYAQKQSARRPVAGSAGGQAVTNVVRNRFSLTRSVSVHLVGAGLPGGPPGIVLWFDKLEFAGLFG